MRNLRKSGILALLAVCFGMLVFSSCQKEELINPVTSETKQNKVDLNKEAKINVVETIDIEAELVETNFEKELMEIFLNEPNADEANKLINDKIIEIYGEDRGARGRQCVFQNSGTWLDIHRNTKYTQVQLEAVGKANGTLCNGSQFKMELYYYHSSAGWQLRSRQYGASGAFLSIYNQYSSAYTNAKGVLSFKHPYGFYYPVRFASIKI